MELHFHLVTVDSHFSFSIDVNRSTPSFEGFSDNGEGSRKCTERYYISYCTIICSIFVLLLTINYRELLTLSVRLISDFTAILNSMQTF